MSHELTVFEWVNRLTNEFNELRIAASDVVKMKAVEAAHEMGLFLNDASVFISNHQPELLSGVLSAATVVLYVYILKRALNAENKVHEIDFLLNTVRSDYQIASDERDRWYVAWKLQDDENDKLNDALNDVHVELRETKESFEAMREEHADSFEEIRSERDEIQERLDDMEEDRDYWMSRSEDYEGWHSEVEAERDEVRDELSSIRSAVPQLAYVA